jgi:hypothetical protein
MKNIKNYKEFLFEAAPRIANDLQYWLKKGKKGKECRIYTHNDLDGIYSGIVMKNYLLKHGFKIDGYGIIEYTEGWRGFILDKSYINIALDYAESVDGVDVYIDHHVSNDSGIEYDQFAIKGKTGSAYELICRVLGQPTDESILSVIDMIDAAKYSEYKVDVSKIMDWEDEETGEKLFKNKLEFAAVFNQMLKRGDHKTIIEIIANCKEPSIYNIFRLYKLFYPENNPITRGAATGVPKEFLPDSLKRLQQVKTRTRGSLLGPKTFIANQEQFKRLFSEDKVIYITPKPTEEDPEPEPIPKEITKIVPKGYQILGQMIFVPTGTWANALRARAIIEKDLNDRDIPDVNYKVTGEFEEELKSMNGEELEVIGDITKHLPNQDLDIKKILTDEDKKDLEGIKGVVVIKGNDVYLKAKQPLFWIMLQYGGSLQVASFRDLKKYDRKYLPKKNGKTIDDLGKYCDNLLAEIKKIAAYQCEDTKSGGHPGIGNISNIKGYVKAGNYKGVRYLDLFKNKMIQDLSGIPWNDEKMAWGDRDEPKQPVKPLEVNRKFIPTDEIRSIKDAERTMGEWRRQYGSDSDDGVMTPDELKEIEKETKPKRKKKED